MLAFSKLMLHKLTHRNQKTERMFDRNQMQQYQQFFKPATCVYIHDTVQFYIGSAYNGLFPSRQYDLIINLAEELTVPKRTDTDVLNFKYTDDEHISVKQSDLDLIVNTVQNMIDSIPINVRMDEKKILFNCFVGSSRSVSFCIYTIGILTELYNFEYIFNKIKSTRPCVNPSLTLYYQISGRLQNKVIQDDKYLNL